MTSPIPQQQRLPTERRTAGANWVHFAIVGLIVIATIALAIWPLHATPAVLPADAPADHFSAERALVDLRMIAAEPHPIGSPRNQVVRAYLLDQIRALGLEPELQRTQIVSSFGTHTIAAVENVLVRVAGQAGGLGKPALLLSGHYDSIAVTSGAADCGGCAATVLEALRAVVAGPPLQNDVIFLFTDGEEVGVLGARAFMEQHSWASDVAMSIVFEGYGPQGASLLYVADPDGGWALDQALDNAQRPLAYSFLHGVMWSLANNTGSDLDAFLESGAPGIALINLSLEGAVAYHSMDDALANYQPGTLQSHGTWAMDLVQHFGNADLRAREPVANPVYFALAPGLTLRYPARYALPLALAAVALYATSLVTGMRRRRLGLRGVAAGAGILLVSIVVAILVVTLAWWGLRWLNVHLHDYRVGGWYGVTWYTAGFCALACAVVATGWWLLRRMRPADLFAGALMVWAILTIIYARGGAAFSYAFVWPLIVASLLLLVWNLDKWPAAGWRTLLLAMLPLVASLLLMGPIVYVLGMYAGRIEATMGFPAAALPTLFVVLVMTMAIPVGSVLLQGRYGRLAAGALVLCAIFLMFGCLRSMPSPARPAANTIVYLLDADKSEARWIAVNDSRMGRGTRGQLDEWTRQFLGATPQTMLFNPWPAGWATAEQPALFAPAPVVDAPRSRIEVASAETAGGGRSLQIVITPAADVLDGEIVLSTEDQILSATVDGVAPSQFLPGHVFQVNRHGRLDAVTVRITTAGAEEVTVRVRDRTMGLPVVEGVAVQPRSSSMIPASLNATADSTVVEQSIAY